MSPPLAKTLYSFRMISKLNSLTQSAIYVVIIDAASSIFCDYHQPVFMTTSLKDVSPSPIVTQLCNYFPF